jgi:hypothetical protein
VEALQWACLGILIVHMGVGWWVAGDQRGRFARRAALLVVGSWIAEDTCIRAYQFYSYNPEWWWFLDKMPLMIAVIWPAVILSAWELVRARGVRGAKAALWTGLLVWADASLIEPIAVKAGLWRWSQPGLFDVPVIGMLGWGIFAGLCAWVFEAAQGRRGEGLREAAGVWVGAVVAAHLGLIAAWWGVFRWVNVTWAAWPVVALVWAGSAALTARSWRSGMRHVMPPAVMATRIPAASFFMVLLAIHGLEEAALAIYALAFVPPYVAATPWRGILSRS